ncbi:site-2 protease family protein [Symmachiella dynata]|uniref:site-2 protease family protein n=1 Tax=Symmachiella dynata TaxID=2527995 RepID=UPI0030EBD79A
MLGNVEPTQYDLRFTIFGIPVRVHPFFWLLAAFIVWNAVDGRLELVAVGIGCVFISVLIHEMGHAAVAISYGWPPRITLYHFGGLASFEPRSGLTPRRSIIISLAGPLAGFALYGIVWGVEFYLIRTGSPLLQRPMVFVAIYFLKWINLYWGILNLLPVFPLDGGQVSRALFTQFSRGSGIPASLKLSLITAGGMAAYFFLNQRMFIGIMMLSLAASSYQQLQVYGRRGW